MRVQSLSVVGAVPILTVGAVGCSKDDSPTEATTNSAATTTAPTDGTGATVTIDGQVEQPDGPVVCATTNGKFSIAIGDVITGVMVGLEWDVSKVRGVGLGFNTYTVKRNASGPEATGKQVGKPFEIVATCP
jgi:lipoprotein LpqH